MSSNRALSLRDIALYAHRYVGLFIATFLVVAGITGSLIAFYVPIDTALNPDLFVAEPPTPNAPMLDPFELRDRLQAQLPSDAHQIHGVVLDIKPHRTVNYWVDEGETFVNPYTGQIQGHRKFGSLREGRHGLMTFIYELHFTLGLSEVGRYLFGFAALLWTLDCFIGAYLTFPRAAKGGGANWFARWLPMWFVKTNRLFSFVFTSHRASGLWVWMMLLTFAWSAVALNLSEVYEPVMRVVFGIDEEPFEPPEKKTKEPPIALRDAYLIGKRLMAEEAKKRGFEILRETGIDYRAEQTVFGYSVESTLDISERLASTSVIFTPAGELLHFEAPTTQNAGVTFSNWIVALHFASIRIGGLSYRIFVCAFGVVVAGLSISGVWIWWDKRKKRVKSVSRDSRS